MRKHDDDWGPALGQEEKSNDTSAKKPPSKKDSLTSLVYEFRDRLMLDTANLFNAQVNAPALMKAFRRLLEAGRSYDDIRRMIVQFNKDIAANPLKDGIPAWQAFLGRLDSLLTKIDNKEEEFTYDGPKIDPRLMRQTHD